MGEAAAPRGRQQRCRGDIDKEKAMNVRRIVVHLVILAIGIAAGFANFCSSRGSTSMIRFPLL
jgi:hypothetical protein